MIPNLESVPLNPTTCTLGKIQKTFRGCGVRKRLPEIYARLDRSELLELLRVETKRRISSWGLNVFQVI